MHSSKEKDLLHAIVHQPAIRSVHIHQTLKLVQNLKTRLTECPMTPQLAINRDQKYSPRRFLKVIHMLTLSSTTLYHATPVAPAIAICGGVSSHREFGD